MVAVTGPTEHSTKGGSDQLDVAAILSSTYSATAPSYKLLWAPIIHRFSCMLLDELPVSRAARVVDVGTGVGTLLPDLQEAASKALVIGVDRAAGMIAEAPSNFPRAVMDARRLAFAHQSFDVVAMAFVLFHLEQPQLGLLEAARVLRRGGTIGALTWGTGSGYPALDLWNEQLDALGADPADERLARHDLVDTPAKMRALLERAGFVSIRTWTRPFEHRQSPDEFLAHRTGHGASKRRFDSLDGADKRTCIGRVRSRLRSLPPGDIIDRAEVVFSVATAEI